MRYLIHFPTEAPRAEGCVGGQACRNGVQCSVCGEQGQVFCMRGMRLSISTPGGLSLQHYCSTTAALLQHYCSTTAALLQHYCSTTAAPLHLCSSRNPPAPPPAVLQPFTLHPQTTGRELGHVQQGVLCEHEVLCKHGISAHVSPHVTNLDCH